MKSLKERIDESINTMKSEVNSNIENSDRYVVSSSAPSNTKKIWIDTSSGGYIEKIYTNGKWTSTSTVWG